MGCIAKQAVEILEGLDIEIKGKQRMPESAAKSDLSQADMIIAVDKSEHEPMIESSFPEYKDKVIYLDVGDVDVEPVYVAIVKLIKRLDTLIAKLA